MQHIHCSFYIFFFKKSNYRKNIQDIIVALILKNKKKYTTIYKMYKKVSEQINSTFESLFCLKAQRINKKKKNLNLNGGLLLWLLLCLSRRVEMTHHTSNRS